MNANANKTRCEAISESVDAGMLSHPCVQLASTSSITSYPGTFKSVQGVPSASISVADSL